MPFIWSAPNGNGPTFAQLEGHIEPRMPDLSSVVSALMRYRLAQQEQQANGLNGLLSGIAKGISGISQQRQQDAASGAADDAANAAIYARQYPQDAMGGFTDPNRVPDYGGVDALRAMRYAGEFGNNTPQPPQLMTLPNGQQILWSPSTGGVHPLSPGTASPDYSDAIKAAKAIVDQYTKSTGITPDLLESSTAVHSGAQNPGSIISKITGGKFGQDIVPEGKYRIDIPESAKEEAHSMDVEAAGFDRAHKALELYNQLMNSRLPGGSAGASTYVPGMGGIEGGKLDATGHPAVTYQVNPQGVTFAVKPTDPRFGMKITAMNPDGRQVTGTATDFGPGVKNVDIASSNRADATSSPFSGATVTPSPQDAGKGLTPGTQRVVLGVTYVWNGDRWNPVK